MKAKLPIVLGLAAALGCGPKVAQKEPKKQAPYAFPHSTHVDADVACTNCHAGIDRSAKLEAGVRHVKIPPRPSRNAVCKDCHDTDPEISIPVRAAPPRFTFSHADHLPRVDGDCKRCHTQLPEMGDTQPKRPPMSACTSCHNHAKDFSRARCQPCHVDLKGYEPESAFRHAGDWTRAHGTFAQPSASTCASCHDQTYCAECHSAATTPARPSIIYPERVERGFIHRGDYVSRHMVDAGVSPASCRRCHGPAFCEACHTQQNLTRLSTTFRDPHPAGWANDRASGHFHGDAARRDISACAGCHDQGAGAVCVGCHRVGGIGGNPHPSSFISKHQGEDRTKNPVCTACHTGP
jgi:hypothetical protein